MQDEATGITHHLVPGDFAFFHVGSKVKVRLLLSILSTVGFSFFMSHERPTDKHSLVQFSTKSQGFAFYAVTRPVRTPHPNLKDREEGKARL